MRTLGVRIVLTSVYAVTAIGLAGCGAGGEPEGGAGGTSAGPSGIGGLGSAPTRPDADDTTTGGSGPDGDSGAGSGAPGGTGDSDGGNSSGGNSSGGDSSDHGGATGGQPAGPRIVSFTVTGQPSCPAGTTIAPIDGTPVTLAWQVNGQPTVTLSVDGPGVYQSYQGPQGSETLAFPCDGAPGTYQKHTYLLTATEHGASTQQTITVQAKINEIAVVEQ
ncbi:hypothetical protein ACN27F_30230 [Solwaraspora sp. WMMB335]|uniref:hypothetical protein n=1 Tax=Solwaraspora sp. WMMB335 TaxID=3404118 RepID=UPI003B94CDE1